MTDLLDFLIALPPCMKPWCTTCAGRPGRERQLQEFAQGRTDLGVQLASISAAQAATLGDRQPLLVFLLRLLPEADLSLAAHAWGQRGISNEVLRALAHEGTDLLQSSRNLWDAVGMRILEFALRDPRGEYSRRAVMEVMNHYGMIDEQLRAQVARDTEESEQRLAQYRAEWAQRRAQEAAAQAQRIRAIKAAERLPLMERLQGLLDGTLGIDPPFPEHWSTLTDEDCASMPLGLQRQIARCGMRSPGSTLRALHVRLHHWRAAERATARREFLAVLELLPPIQQVARLCEGTEPVYWFPASLAAWIMDKHEVLAQRDVAALRSRIGHVRRGGWRPVARLLATA